jgi:hypothetical protein
MVLGWDSARSWTTANAAATTTSMTLTWAAVAADGSKAAIVGYVVERVNGSSYEPVCITTGLTCIATGLTIRSSYSFRITPYTVGAIPVFIKMASPSSWNASVVASPKTGTITATSPLVMDAPTGVSALAGATSVTLWWTTSAKATSTQKYLVKDSTDTFFCLATTTSCTIGGRCGQCDAGWCGDFVQHRNCIDGSVGDPGNVERGQHAHDLQAAGVGCVFRYCSHDHADACVDES